MILYDYIVSPDSHRDGGYVTTCGASPRHMVNVQPGSISAKFTTHLAMDFRQQLAAFYGVPMGI